MSRDNLIVPSYISTNQLYKVKTMTHDLRSKQDLSHYILVQ